MTPTLLLLHGWALRPGLWRPLAQEMNLPLLCPDWGYYGPPDMDLPPHGPLILAGHSLGFLWWLHRLEHDPSLRQRTIGLISINGFSRFSQAPDFPHGIPQRVIQRMLTRLNQNPRALLDEFGRACGLRTPAPPENLQHPLLADGLNALASRDERATLRDLPHPLLALASEDDAIVPPALTRACFTTPNPHLRLAWHPRGQHLLPLLQPAWCAREITDFIHTLPPHAP